MDHGLFYVLPVDRFWSVWPQFGEQYVQNISDLCMHYLYTALGNFTQYYFTVKQTLYSYAKRPKHRRHIDVGICLSPLTYLSNTGNSLTSKIMNIS